MTFEEYWKDHEPFGCDPEEVARLAYNFAQEETTMKLNSKWQQHAQAAIVDLTAALALTAIRPDPAAAHEHLVEAAKSIGRALGSLEDELEPDETGGSGGEWPAE